MNNRPIEVMQWFRYLNSLSDYSFMDVDMVPETWCELPDWDLVDFIDELLGEDK